MVGPLIDQLKWFGFKHEAKEFLIWFGFEDDGFSIESVVKEDFIWCQCSEAFVSKYETIVNVTDVSNEQMMVGEKLMEGNGLNLFTDGDYHKA